MYGLGARFLLYDLRIEAVFCSGKVNQQRISFVEFSDVF